MNNDDTMPCFIVTPKGVFYAENARLSGIFVDEGKVTELTVVGHATVDDPFKPVMRKLEIPDEHCAWAFDKCCGVMALAENYRPDKGLRQ